MPDIYPPAAQRGALLTLASALGNRAIALRVAMSAAIGASMGGSVDAHGSLCAGPETTGPGSAG